MSNRAPSEVLAVAADKVSLVMGCKSGSTPSHHGKPQSELKQLSPLFFVMPNNWEGSSCAGESMFNRESGAT